MWRSQSHTQELLIWKCLEPVLGPTHVRCGGGRRAVCRQVFIAGKYLGNSVSPRPEYVHSDAMCSDHVSCTKCGCRLSVVVVVVVIVVVVVDDDDDDDDDGGDDDDVDVHVDVVVDIDIDSMMKIIKYS